jgi:flavin reductase (DIM6/NTAB) family NADH-FMN oxidoreductase RutF
MAKPGGTGVIGPFPPDVEDTDDAREEYDRRRRRVLWAMPSGLYVIGSTDHALKRQLMTANWVMQVSFEPKLVAVSIDVHAFTHELVSAAGVFSVCLVDREDRAIVRKFTKPVEVDLVGRTLNGFEFVEAVTGAPILASAVAYLDCRVNQTVPCGGHTLFVGEVADSAFLKDEAVAVLRMEDTRMSYGG